MAIAAGFEVATTASAHNQQYCKDLGAKWVFDYKSEAVVDDMVTALAGEKVAGVMDAWSRGDFPWDSAKVALQLRKGEGKAFLQTVMTDVLLPKELPDGLALGHGM